MKRILMKANFRQYRYNCLYDVGDDLADNLVRQGKAEIMADELSARERGSLETATEEAEEHAVEEVGKEAAVETVEETADETPEKADRKKKGK